MGHGQERVEKALVPREPVRGAAPRDDVQVNGGPTRCACCHAQVDGALDDWVACRVCLARHHPECWGEVGACAVCATHTFVSTRGARPVSRSRGVAIGVALLGATLAGLVSFIPFVCMGGGVGRTLGPFVMVLGTGTSTLFGGWASYQLARRT